ncbi:ORF2 [Sandewavirus dungfly]|nr:ORF2 [Sandewavirus dungfly]
MLFLIVLLFTSVCSQDYHLGTLPDVILEKLEFDLLPSYRYLDSRIVPEPKTHDLSFWSNLFASPTCPPNHYLQHLAGSFFSDKKYLCFPVVGSHNEIYTFKFTYPSSQSMNLKFNTYGKDFDFNVTVSLDSPSPFILLQYPGKSDTFLTTERCMGNHFLKNDSKIQMANIPIYYYSDHIEYWYHYECKPLRVDLDNVFRYLPVDTHFTIVGAYPDYDSLFDVIEENLVKNIDVPSEVNFNLYFDSVTNLTGLIVPQFVNFKFVHHEREKAILHFTFDNVSFFAVAFSYVSEIFSGFTSAIIDWFFYFLRLLYSSIMKILKSFNIQFKFLIFVFVVSYIYYSKFIKSLIIVFVVSLLMKFPDHVTE